MTCSVAPDLPVKNVVVEWNLEIVPVLWKFDSHSELAVSITAFDGNAVAKWLDDRIVGFVELFIQMHESQVVEKAEYVEDPIAKIKFPKFAAGATLERGGQTYYFVDDTTKAEFAKK